MIAVVGAGGQLGLAVMEALARCGLPAEGFTREMLDVSNRESVKHCFAKKQYDCVINCAAYTAVDASESHQEEAFVVNGLGPQYLAEAGIPIVHISTDYVFDGEKTSPYDVDDAPAPLSVYGRSKRAGEEALLAGNGSGMIIRTAWLYSARSGTRNFLHTMRRLLSERETLGVVNDQRGTPTSAEDLAEAIAVLVKKGVHKAPMQVLHFTNSGSTTWFGFAQGIQQHLGTSCAIRPITTAEYPMAARRPANSVLSLNSIEALGIHPRSWESALADACAHLN